MSPGQEEVESVASGSFSTGGSDMVLTSRVDERESVYLHTSVGGHACQRSPSDVWSHSSCLLR